MRDGGTYFLLGHNLCLRSPQVRLVAEIMYAVWPSVVDTCILLLFSFGQIWGCVDWCTFPNTIMAGGICMQAHRISATYRRAILRTRATAQSISKVEIRFANLPKWTAADAALWHSARAGRAKSYQ